MRRSDLRGCRKEAHAWWRTPSPSWQSCRRSALLLVRSLRGERQQRRPHTNRPQTGTNLQVYWRLNGGPCLTFFFVIVGGMTILPTVLFLITGVLKETAIKTADTSVPVPVSAALQGIKTIITSPLARAESIQTQWTGLVRSSLASALEYSQPGKYTTTHLSLIIVYQFYFNSRWPTNQCQLVLVPHWLLCLLFFVDESKPDMDEVSMLTAITLFLLSASGELVGVMVLQNGCVDRFRNALNSSDPWVRTDPFVQTG